MTTANTDVELDLVVARRTDEAHAVVSLELRRPDGAPLPSWTPGAHVDLILENGLVRQYSLCSTPHDPHAWRIGILHVRDGRGGSRHIHGTLHEGTALRVRGPRNNFPLLPAERHVFIAGGIGITPILPMLEEAERQGSDWELVYGGRSRESMAFREELLKRYPDRVRLHPQDQHGMLDLDALLGTPRPETLVYCCGPEGLLGAVEDRCTAWPDGTLHLERFIVREQPAPLRTETFEAELAKSGITVTVPPDRSILEVVEAAGVKVPTSCREGICGTCETDVLAGVVDHRDSVLTPEEQAAHDTMMVCVSRAACPRLVLSL
ncbi:oxidoreductase [Streptomyces sp. 110]|uniref:Oxidoreductase n=1 Tax=Streptomyces endocoffeicus TaxID=2898945 RepID=A0ABS1PVL9_9ACTN|nr:PDR/VanB family oxidoreductase [Streptomyces endocoffeicus]MBL1116476.1 oxidoreductase [Streptomyces endocoffeicus]